MAAANVKRQAINLVNSVFPSGNSRYWPHLNGPQVKQGLIDRINDPSMIQQHGANVCGMAAFAHTLASDDPVQYVWYGIWMFKHGYAALGRGSGKQTVKASEEVRRSKIPSGMNHADWIVLASLRDHLNTTIDYAYDMGVPVLRDIPILSVVGQLLADTWEAVGGITWPEEVSNSLRAVGYSQVRNEASVDRLGGYKKMNEASNLFTRGYQVLMLINTRMLGQDPAWQQTADHWVKLVSEVEENRYAFPNITPSSGVTFHIFNSAHNPTNHKVPINPKASYLPLRMFTNNFYGYIAAKL